MTLGTKIGIALGICILAIVIGIWQVANARGYKGRGRRRSGSDRSSGGDRQSGGGASSQRKSDVRQLSGAEKKLYQESQRLLAQGRIQPAARILEQLNMPREAIQALEDAGLIHDAAKILMRMGRPNRAGVVYARHGMWDHAAQCFKMANMPLEVAKCSREAGNWEMAAENFEKVGRFEDAADCFMQMNDLHRAARHYSSAGNKPRAMEMYNRLAKQAENLQAIEFHEEELRQIVDYLGEGHTDAGLAAVVVSRNKLTEVVLNLIGKGKVKQAAELFQRASSDIGPMLMAEVSYQTRAAEVLADVFLAVANYHYAGMVYERMSAFDRAGAAFEKAEDYERAAYCYERAGLDAKVRQLKEKAKTQPYRGPRPPGSPGLPNAFALSNVPSDTASQQQAASSGPSFGDDEAESTQIVEAAGEGAPVLAPRGLPPVGAGDKDKERENWSPPRATPPPPTKPAFPAPTHLGDGKPPSPFRLDPEDEPETPAAAAPPSASTTLPSLRALGHEDNAPKSGPPTTLPPVQITTAEIGEAPAPVDTTDTETEDAVTLEDGRAAFHRAKFLADLDFEQRNKIWAVGRTLAFNEGDTVLNYNDEPRGVYIIVRGSVSCYRQVTGRETYVDQMGESETFGELWLLADQPTAVRFVASKDTRIRVIDRGAFNDLLDKDGTIARKVYKRFTMRLLKRLLKPANLQKNQQAS